MTISEYTRVGNVRITHSDKIVYPEDGYTKGDVVRYYDKIASRLLPHIVHRLISLVRCPEGQAGHCFFQRHMIPGFPPDIKPFNRPEKLNSEAYLYIEKKAGLISLAQMGVLELHIWGSHTSTLQKPDRIVFDLDPADDVSFERVKEAAFRLRELLLALGLKSFPLLSGGKGIHVVAPIIPQHEWPVIKEFTAALAGRVSEDQPDRYVDTMTKSKRPGKIFIDFFRNDRTATAIAPYSTRARPGAPLAWPVTWTKLPSVKTASAVTLGNFQKWLTSSDPWARYGMLRQPLSAAALTALGVTAERDVRNFYGVGTNAIKG